MVQCQPSSPKVQNPGPKNKLKLLFKIFKLNLESKALKSGCGKKFTFGQPN